MQQLIAEKRKRSTLKAELQDTVRLRLQSDYLGSVANVIVVESAREHLEIDFWD